MIRTASRWFSPRLEAEVSLVRWGHYGTPVMLFPTAGGDAEEVERMHLIGALRPLIEAGRIKVYSCDSVAGKALAEDLLVRVVAHAQPRAFHLDQLGVVGGGPQHAAVVVAGVPEQHRLATLFKQAGRMRSPGVQRQPLRQA